jgi:hypothetical protein
MLWGSKLLASVLSLIVGSLPKCDGILDYKGGEPCREEGSGWGGRCGLGERCRAGGWVLFLILIFLLFFVCLLFWYFIAHYFWPFLALILAFPCIVSGLLAKKAGSHEPVRILVCRGHETITEITSYDRSNRDQEEQEPEGAEAVP